MNNPLHSPLMRLFERLTFLKGLLIHLKTQYDNYPPLLEKSLEDHNLDPSQLTIAGSALGIRDLTQPVDSFRGTLPVGVSVSRNLDEYQHMLEDILCRNCGWAVAQGYEAFDTFLKDTTAIYIQENIASITPSILQELTPSKKTRRELSRAGFLQTDFEYWRSGVADARWKNKKILDKIRENFSPKLKSVEQDNQPSIDLIEWFDIVSEVRHAATHSKWNNQATETKPRLGTAHTEYVFSWKCYPRGL